MKLIEWMKQVHACADASAWVGDLSIDWYVRTFTSTWLELANLHEHASKIRKLEEISSLETLVAAREMAARAAEMADLIRDSCEEALPVVPGLLTNTEADIRFEKFMKGEPKMKTTKYKLGDGFSLIAAAYNSYVKHCGPRAIECAEADLLGEALDVSRCLRAAAVAIINGIPSDFKKQCERLDTVLAKAGVK